MVTNQDGTKSVKIRPHTYFAIMADDGKTQPYWKSTTKKDKVVHGDVMAYALGPQADIEKGYCFLILGTLFEFYEYDGSNDIQPVRPFPHEWWPKNWTQDMYNPLHNQQTPWIAHIWFDMLAAKDIIYEDGTIGKGVEGKASNNEPGPAGDPGPAS